MAELRSYDPTWREWLGGLIAGDSNSYSGRSALARGLVGSSGLGSGLGLIDLVPVAGQAVGAQEAIHDGDYKGAALSVMPLGGVARAAPRGLAHLAERFAHSMPQAADDVGEMSLRRLGNSLESKTVSGYNPPAKTPRAFEADYPAGAPADAAGRLAADIEGRPLTADYIAGRRMVGGRDESLSPAEIRSVGETGTGGVVEAVAPSQIRGAAGAVVVQPGSRLPGKIFLSDKLTEAQAGRVLPHEVGHVVDQLANEIPTDGLPRELGQVYNTLNTGRERTTKLMGPQHIGYKGEEVGREYMAEAIRGYMLDPNYLKTVAPKTAARIREYVNSNPRLSKIIQFNSVLGAGAVGGGLAGQNDSDGI